MSYVINDENLIKVLSDNDSPFSEFVSQATEQLAKEYGKEKEEFLGCFEHPLDETIVGKLKDLIPTGSKTIPYSKVDSLDKLWQDLLNKAIICLRYFDSREPFLDNSRKSIVAYGIDNLNEYHKRYTEFESLMYGASSYYRDHVFHAVRVWMLGVFCLTMPMTDSKGETVDFVSKLRLDGGAKLPGKINFFEYISMWTIIALCHDLGYPLEKSEQILDRTRKMMKEFIPNPNIWNNFGFSGVQDNINEYILKFISTKMKEDTDAKQSDNGAEEEQKDAAPVYVGRIQPKYYLKYAKSLEKFQHGVISAVIIYKMLLYFLESDFNLNDDYIYKEEDARQFYIRREILRAISSHTCPDAYNIHITTFSSLLFLCDELQEWGRKAWNELYTGLSESSISLNIETFSHDTVSVEETIDMTTGGDDIGIVAKNIGRVFERQYSLYKTTFRDGQYTASRDFSLKKTMRFLLPEKSAQAMEIKIEYSIPKSEESFFRIDLSKLGGQREAYQKSIQPEVSAGLYAIDVSFV